MDTDSLFLNSIRNCTEAKFREAFLIPLLQRMGYRDVIEYHGNAEKGKDIICWYLDPSGQKRFVALVVKKGNIHGAVGKPGNASEILSQTQQVFDEPYTDIYGLKEVVMDECWVVVTGDILDTAVESIRGRLRKSNLEKFVRFLDSRKILDLFRIHYPQFILGDMYLSLLIHEIKTPFSVIRGAAELLQREANDYGYQFAHDYAGDISSWCDLGRRLLQNADFFRFREGKFPLRLERVYLLRELFAPARNQISPLLRERDYERRRISDDGFKAIPAVWVDRNQFQQVFFNLLSNSIKYCNDDPSSFRVEVATEDAGNVYRIRFRDWGIGIPQGYEKSIFEEGLRGPNAELHSVSGDGLGLWIVSRIIEAHGGSIWVANPANPTEFTIELPHSITQKWAVE